MAKYNSRGQEIPDARPVAVPHGWERPLSLQEEIRRLVRTEFSRQAVDAGQESFEEADDFDVDDDEDLVSPYEIPEGAPEVLGGVKDEDAAPPPDPKEKPPKEAVIASKDKAPE